MTGAELDRLLFHWPAVVKAAPDGWAKEFAKSIAGQARRCGWRPSRKQSEIMRQMVSELFTDPCALSDPEVLIED